MGRSRFWAFQGEKEKKKQNKTKQKVWENPITNK